MKTMGRPPGSPNKATASAREAIGAFVDANSPRLQGWLDQIATGVPKPGEEGEYIINPNPAKAFELFQSVVEYHVPKLARTELGNIPGDTFKVTLESSDGGIL